MECTKATCLFSAAMPRISIIMAARNTAPYLDECLRSIQAQTFTDWELLAINDRSEDATKEILLKYAKEDPRIKVLDSKGERLIPALQTGYAASKGELINRMDSDDRMPPYKLQLMLDEWKKHGKGTLVAGGTEHFPDEGELGDGFKRYDGWLNKLARTNTHWQEIYTECVIPSHCWLMHREDLDKAGAFDPNVYPEDYDLCFRFYRTGLKVAGIDKVLHQWRDRSDRISRTWAEYQDNRYFELKLPYFLELDRDHSRPLVIWGAGQHGKALAKLLIAYGEPFRWVCDNPNKIGHNIYGVVLEDQASMPELVRPQMLIVLMAEEDRKYVRSLLDKWEKRPVEDYWSFC